MRFWGYSTFVGVNKPGTRGDYSDIQSLRGAIASAVVVARIRVVATSRTGSPSTASGILIFNVQNVPLYRFELHFAARCVDTRRALFLSMSRPRLTQVPSHSEFPLHGL